MKYGIVGNREGWTYTFIKRILQELDITHEDTLISGGCEGVDTHAQTYAKETGCTIIIMYPKPHEPSPDRYFNRNKEIAETSDVLIAFDKGSSKGSGTLNTINHARRAGKKVIIFKNENEFKNVTE